MVNTPKIFQLAPLALLATAAVASPALAFPLGNGQEAQRSAPSTFELEAAEVDFTAIIRLSNCSGSLVRFTTSRPTDSALVLTNGHCIGNFPPQGTAVVNQASSRTFSLLSSNGQTTLATLRASRLVYATMSGTDIGIYRLTSTYAQIQSSYGVTALTLSNVHPTVSTPIRVVSGYWKKIYSCAIDKFIYELREDQWRSHDSIKYSRPGCETIGGTSGSPIIHAQTREIIGINSTGNEDGERCTMNNPCEVDQQGRITVDHGASYGEETYQIYTCLDGNNQLDLNKAGCKLQKPRADVSELFEEAADFPPERGVSEHHDGTTS
ncbi:trypsin-like serine peptidase [Pendulispora albinea]|uniref:Serine protease n=1 Tax=Pendulispora albinea TaxID=2741071 RepID=A0ABZ2M365_9BACT